ncbi:MAG: hypothetical protein SFY81_04550 [Verrucomicrobiota bacterium]|nr:hypothetical protein [Verrucomicrobiota bacterium]
MHLHAFVPALYFYKKNPGIFKEDFDFIREIATVRDSDIFKSELNRFHGRNLRDKSWLRGTFAVRLSGKRLIRLKNEVIKGLD